MKAAFHKDQPVGNKIFEILGRDPSQGISDLERERVNQVIKGLHCSSMYTGRLRNLKIEGLSQNSAANSRFEMAAGNSCSVQKYFRDKYEIDLQWVSILLILIRDVSQISQRQSAHLQRAWKSEFLSNRTNENQ